MLWTPVFAQESPPRDPATILPLLNQGAQADRDAAAEDLLNLARRPELARQLGTLLVAPETPVEARLRVLAAIGRSWDPPGRLFKPIVELANSTDPAVAAAALGALGAFRTREALETIASFTGDKTPEPLRTAAFAALIQTTGRDELGSDPEAWKRWLDESRRLTGTEWQDLIAQGVWHRSVRLAGERAAMADLLTDGYRRLYLSLPAPPANDRPRLIAQLLMGQQPDLRNLAFDLVSRELSAGNPVDGTIARAAGTLLDSPDAAVRARAANLVVQLAPPDAGTRMASALAAETDPAAAQELLRGVARWPVSAAREPVLHWMEFGDRPSLAAQDAALALVTAGILNAPDDRARVLLAARSACADAPTAAACRLRVLLGESADRDVVTGLLQAQTASVRLAAAQALADRPEAGAAMVAAARSDPALYPLAVQATAACRANLDGYTAIEQLPAPSPAARDEGLRRVAGAMSATDLLRVASRPGMDPGLCDAILSRLTEHGPRPHADDPHAIFEGIVLLARTRLALKRPDLALAALNALPPCPEGVDPAKALRLRVIALLWTNHITEAAALNAPVLAWIDGLEAAIAEPHSAAIFREIKSRFGPSLGLDESRRLDGLALRIMANPGGTDPNASDLTTSAPDRH